MPYYGLKQAKDDATSIRNAPSLIDAIRSLRKIVDVQKTDEMREYVQNAPTIDTHTLTYLIAGPLAPWRDPEWDTYSNYALRSALREMITLRDHYRNIEGYRLLFSALKQNVINLEDYMDARFRVLTIDRLTGKVTAECDMGEF